LVKGPRMQTQAHSNTHEKTFRESGHRSISVLSPHCWTLWFLSSQNLENLAFVPFQGCSKVLMEVNNAISIPTNFNCCFSHQILIVNTEIARLSIFVFPYAEFSLSWLRLSLCSWTISAYMRKTMIELFSIGSKRVLKRKGKSPFSSWCGILFRAANQVKSRCFRSMRDLFYATHLVMFLLKT
jgi:hypothetical protein